MPLQTQQPATLLLREEPVSFCVWCSFLTAEAYKHYCRQAVQLDSLGRRSHSRHPAQHAQQDKSMTPALEFPDPASWREFVRSLLRHVGIPSANPGKQAAISIRIGNFHPYLVAKTRIEWRSSKHSEIPTPLGQNFLPSVLKTGFSKRQCWSGSTRDRKTPSHSETASAHAT